MTHFVRHRKSFSTPGSAGSHHFSPVGRTHTLTKTVFVFSFSVRGLKSSFHLIISLMRGSSKFGAANISVKHKLTIARWAKITWSIFQAKPFGLQELPLA